MVSGGLAVMVISRVVEQAANKSKKTRPNQRINELLTAIPFNGWRNFFPLAPGFAGVSRDDPSAIHAGRKDRSLLAQTPAKPGANGKRQLPPLNGIAPNRRLV
jgi:hypothetical protein